MLTEAEFASWQEELGRRVTKSRGRYWEQVVPGFWQPIHPLAQLRQEEAAKPTRLCWGFRARLASEDEEHANVEIPVHLVPNLPGYSLQRLSKRRRQQVRTALREIDVVAVLAPDILIDQGYELAEEAHAQNAHVRLPSPSGFRRVIEFYLRPGRGLVLAAMRHGRLLGFTLSHGVDGAAYEHLGFIGHEGFKHNVSLALFHVLTLIAQRTPGTGDLANGLHAREQGGLCAFKRSQGLEVVRMPGRAWFAPMAERLLRRLRPHPYYRLTGRG